MVADSRESAVEFVQVVEEYASDVKCKNPQILKSGVTVNCGKCMACRINYTSAWKLRLLYELSEWDSAMFITLTYDEGHVPGDFSLHKKDPVGFFKRLRAYLAYNSDRQIKYYCCGEYGDKKDITRPDKNHGRPHYHAVIFGLNPFDDNDRKLIVEAWQHRCEDWQFDRNRGKLNQYGIGEKSAIQNVTPEDIEYVTGYVQKKLSGSLAGTTYGDDEPPFAIMSKGLGLEFALSNAHRLRTNGFTYLSGHKISLPRYYREKLEIDIDYSKVPGKTKEQYEAELDYLSQLFVEDMKRKYGLDYSEFKVQNVKDLDLKTRRFEQWYENHRWQLADRVYQDFLQRQKMRNGL